MPPKAKTKGKSRTMSKKAKERKERKLLEERINNSKQKCEEARAFMEPTGKRAGPDYVKAKDALNAAIELYSAHTLPYFLMGECYRAQGELVDAVDFYSKALDSDPRYVPALEARAFCYQKMKDVPHAIEDYSSMIELEPDNDHAHNMRGMCLASTRVPGLRLKIADFKRCESDLNTAARLNEANYYALANLGKVYEDQGELEDALICYTASLQVKETYTYARFRRGCTALQLGEKALATDKDVATEVGCVDDDLAGTAVPSGPTSVAIESMSDIEGEAREKLREDERRAKVRKALIGAEVDFAALVESAPDADPNLADVNVVLNLGVCAMLLGDFAKAEAFFNQVEKIIAARPALVAAEEAAPIEDADHLLVVLGLRREELQQKQQESTAPSS